MSFIYDYVQPSELIGFARGLEFPEFTLDNILPNRPVDDIEYKFNTGRLFDGDAATYRAWDTEAPIAKRQGIRAVRGELPPISRKIRLGEEDRHRLRKLQGGDGSSAVAQVFDDTAAMVRAVQARVELARGQALSTGAVTINENGMDAQVSFGVPANHFVTAGTLWSDPDADVIGQLTAWNNTYRESTRGGRLGIGVTSSTVLSNLTRNNQIRNLVAVGGVAPAIVSIDAVNNVLAAHNLPRFVAYDTAIYGEGGTQRILPENTVSFIPGEGVPFGQTLYGVTAEAMELAGDGMIDATAMPGVVAVNQKSFDPVATWTLASAISLPVLGSPEHLMVATVLEGDEGNG